MTNEPNKEPPQIRRASRDLARQIAAWFAVGATPTIVDGDVSIKWEIEFPYNSDDDIQPDVIV